MLVTEDGVEILTARLADSPGGPVPMPVVKEADDTPGTSGGVATDGTAA